MLEDIRRIIDKWTPLAADVAGSDAGMPVTVLTGEALDLSHFISRHWEPVAGEHPRPGMRAAQATGLINENTALELRELVMAVSHAHAEYRAVTVTTLEAPVERGKFLLSEMQQGLEFLFDDGLNDVQDAELERLRESHSATGSHDALALSLEGFASYANRFRDRLEPLPEFEVDLIDEALVVAQRLRAQSGLKLVSETRERRRQELAFRNRLITLLLERVGNARRAARYVFRHHPDVARLASSVYERQRRARTRAARRSKETSEEVVVPMTMREGSGG